MDFSLLDPDAPTDLGEAIKGGQLDNLATLLANAGDQVHHQIKDLTLALPIPRPGKILCLGLNYMDHVAEGPFDKQPFQQFLCVVRPHWLRQTNRLEPLSSRKPSIMRLSSQLSLERNAKFK